MNDPERPPIDPTPEPDLSGRQLGDYRLLRRLGRGGMAAVYLAEQISLRRRVAVKVLRQSLAVEDGYVQRFHNEAHAAAALVHANIVQIFEVGCIDGIHFITQEYVDGPNLKQLVSRAGAIDIPRAVLIMRQVAAALYKAGKHGVVHRDIKPENILIGPDGEAKVADFGLARITSDPSKMDLTQVGMTMGTPLYMSPEQVEGRELDSRSDIYSLGVTCYHMLTGRPPFEGETALNVAVQHLKNPPPRVESLRSDVPRALGDIIHKMLAKAPGERFRSAAELVRELRKVNVEGLEADPSNGLVDLAASEQAALADLPLEATQRLQSLMSDSVALAKQGWTRRSWGAVGLVVCLAGSVLAWSTRPADVLELRPGEHMPKVEKKDTVEEQFYYAMRMNDEETWKKVWEYFPSDTGTAEERGRNKTYKRRAKQHLARLYLHNRDFERALELYTELAELDQVEEEFRAYGRAGQALAYWGLGDREKAISAWASASAEPLSRHLDFYTRGELRQLGQALSQRPND